MQPTRDKLVLPTTTKVMPLEEATNVVVVAEARAQGIRETTVIPLKMAPTLMVFTPSSPRGLLGATIEELTEVTKTVVISSALNGEEVEVTTVVEATTKEVVVEDTTGSLHALLRKSLTLIKKSLSWTLTK